jgi:thymidylate kinase
MDGVVESVEEEESDIVDGDRHFRSGFAADGCETYIEVERCEVLGRVVFDGSTPWFEGVIEVIIF